MSIWSATATPATASSFNFTATEVGTRFRTAVAGHIQGVRFYKGSANTGTHVGHLWTATGQLLGTVTFTGRDRDPVAVRGVRLTRRHTSEHAIHRVVPGATGALRDHNEPVRQRRCRQRPDPGSAQRERGAQRHLPDRLWWWVPDQHQQCDQLLGGRRVPTQQLTPAEYDGAHGGPVLDQEDGGEVTVVQQRVSGERGLRLGASHACSGGRALPQLRPLPRSLRGKRARPTRRRRRRSHRR